MVQVAVQKSLSFWTEPLIPSQRAFAAFGLSPKPDIGTRSPYVTGARVSVRTCRVASVVAHASALRMRSSET